MDLGSRWVTALRRSLFFRARVTPLNRRRGGEEEGKRLVKHMPNNQGIPGSQGGAVTSLVTTIHKKARFVHTSWIKRAKTQPNLVEMLGVEPRSGSAQTQRLRA